MIRSSSPKLSLVFCAGLLASTAAAQTVASPAQHLTAQTFEVFERTDSVVTLRYDAGVYAQFADLHAADEAVLLQGVALPGGINVDLRLAPFDVMATGATGQVVDADGSVTTEELTVRLFRGSIPGRTSTVFLAPALHQMNGFVELDGVTYILSTGGDSLDGTMTIGRGRDMFSREGAKDWCKVVDTQDYSEPVEVPVDFGQDEAFLGVDLVSVLNADVWVELDNAFRSRFNSNVACLDYGATLIGASGFVYRRDLGMTLTIPNNYIRVWNSVPPWGAANDFNTIGPFRSWWNSNANPNRFVPRATVHLLTNPVFGGVAANIHGACSNSTGYQVSSCYGAFPQPLAHHHPDNWDPIVVSHEMGHTFGSQHTFDYSPEILCVDGSGPDAGTIMSYCHLNQGGANNVGLRFHERVQSHLINHLNNESCVSSSLVQVGDFDGDGSLDQDDVDALAGVIGQGFVSLGSQDILDMDRDGDIDNQDLAIIDGIVNPVLIEAYCTSLPNVSGQSASMFAFGTASISSNDLTLIANGTPPTNTGIFITGRDSDSTPLGNGILCIGTQTLGFVVRYPGNASDFFGDVFQPLDHTNPPLAGVAEVNPGDTWYYQYWFRDPVNAGFNFSTAMRVTYIP